MSSIQNLATVEKDPLCQQQFQKTCRVEEMDSSRQLEMITSQQHMGNKLNRNRNI
jgi:hypothetical protein